MASLKLMGVWIVGMTERFDCFAAASEMLCQRVTLLSTFFSSIFMTQRFIATGTISKTPSSTDFWMIVSNLSDLGSPWKRKIFEGSSLPSSFMKARSQMTVSLANSFIMQRYSASDPSMFTEISSPGFRRSTFFMWFTSLPAIVIVLSTIASGATKKWYINDSFFSYNSTSL